MARVVSWGSLYSCPQAGVGNILPTCPLHRRMLLIGVYERICAKCTSQPQIDPKMQQWIYSIWYVLHAAGQIVAFCSSAFRSELCQNINIWRRKQAFKLMQLVGSHLLNPGYATFPATSCLETGSAFSSARWSLKPAALLQSWVHAVTARKYELS